MSIIHHSLSELLCCLHRRDREQLLSGSGRAPGHPSRWILTLANVSELVKAIIRLLLSTNLLFKFPYLRFLSGKTLHIVQYYIHTALTLAT